MKNGLLRAKRTNDWAKLWNNGTIGIYDSGDQLLVEFGLHSQAFNRSFGDWFLPSYNELLAMYNELHLEGVGNFGFGYVSSSEFDATRVWGLEFATGNSWLQNKAWSDRHRFCRVFIGGIGDYALRDVGPAGGLIFHIENDVVYYEASLTDVIRTWSNITDVAIGSTSVEIGQGPHNTLDIVNQSGHTSSIAQDAIDHASDATLHDSSKGGENGLATETASYGILRSESWLTTTPGPGTTAPPPAEVLELSGIKVITGSDPSGLSVIMISNTSIVDGQLVTLNMLNYVESKGIQSP